jgi:hypothetical protein
MLLIELYDIYVFKKSKDKKDDEIDPLDKNDIHFLISYDCGRLIDNNRCLVEFYFLLLADEYDLATFLLSQNYAHKLRDDLNQLFIGDENNLLEHILMNPDIVKVSIQLALKRQLDGIA